MVSKDLHELLADSGFAGASSWHLINARMSTWQNQHQSSSWGHWAGGWNGFVFRLLGIHGDAERLRQLLSERGGDAPAPVVRSQQEHLLFGFYATGLSALENFAFATNAFGAFLKPEAFPLGNEQELKTINPKAVGQRFLDVYPNERLSSELERVSVSSDFERWSLIRNVLSHRAAPGRLIHAQAGNDDRGSRPAEWMDEPLDADRIARDEGWLFRELTALVLAADEFATRYF